MRIAFQIAFIGTLGVILWLALSRQPPSAATLLWDKGNHLLAFFVLAFLLDFGWSGYWAKWLGLWLFGCAIELGQWWSGYRFFEFWDICADTIGIAIYVVCQSRIRSVRWLAPLKLPERDV